MQYWVDFPFYHQHGKLTGILYTVASQTTAAICASSGTLQEMQTAKSCPTIVTIAL